MRTLRTLSIGASLFGLCLLAPAGCGGDDTTGGPGADSGADGTSPRDSGADTHPNVDSGRDSGSTDSATSDSSVADSSLGDSAADSMPADSGAMDSATEDSGTMDSGMPVDSGVDTGVDAGMDSGGMCTGSPMTHDVLVGPNGTISYQPSTLTICAGDTVHWIWMSSGHTVTSGTPGMPDGMFCSPNDMNCASGTTSNAGATYDHLFPAAGAFPYYCVPHGFSGMTGQVTVQ